MLFCLSKTRTEFVIASVLLQIQVDGGSEFGVHGLAGPRLKLQWMRLWEGLAEGFENTFILAVFVTDKDFSIQRIRRVLI